MKPGIFRQPQRAVALLLVMAVSLSGCSAMVQVDPYRSAADIEACRQEDARLLAVAEDFDQGIEKAGHLYGNAELDAYLQKILDDLFPDFRGRMRVRVVRATTLNAFALPNGSIYVHLGLLSALADEAQIASVLAHEGVHFVNRHALHQTQHGKLNTGLVQIITLAGLPFGAGIVGLPALAVAASSMAGYSRDLEREADAGGYERLAAAGYDCREAVIAFRYLLEEAETREDKTPFFFASHPALQERIDHFEELNRTRPAEGTRTGAGEFVQNTAAARLVGLEEDLSRHRHVRVIQLLTDERRRSLFPAYVSYHLGEAYRQRGKDGDPELALGAYRAAVAADPGYAPSYRALGLYFMKQRDLEQAERYLEEYLRRADRAGDRAYIETYLAQVREEK